MSEFEPALSEPSVVVAQEMPLWLDPALYEMLAIVGLIILAGSGMTIVFRGLLQTHEKLSGDPAAMTGEDYAGMGLDSRKTRLRERK